MLEVCGSFQALADALADNVVAPLIDREVPDQWNGSQLQRAGNHAKQNNNTHI